MTAEQRFVGGKGARMQLLKERAFQKERLAVAKDVWQDSLQHVWHVEVTRNPLWVERRDKMVERLVMRIKR